MSPITFVFNNAEPILSACRTPFHLGIGCGAFQRRSPTGGAAKGTPLKIRTVRSALVVPATTPASVFTSSDANRLATKIAMTVNGAIQRNLANGDIVLSYAKGTGILPIANPNRLLAQPTSIIHC